MDDDLTSEPGADASGRERSGRLTTMIPRPSSRRASDAGRSRVGDVRRPGRTDRISSRRAAWLFGLAALVIVAALAAALFGLPVRTWFDQNDRIDALEYELREMQSVNGELGEEVARLQTDAGIREAAREELGQIEPGDRRESMGVLPALPRNFPVGWPYSQIGDIMRLRTEQAAAATAATPAADDPRPSGGFQPFGATTAPSSPSTPPATSPAAPTTVSAAVTSTVAASTVPTTAAPTTAVPTTLAGPQG